MESEGRGECGQSGSSGKKKKKKKKWGKKKPQVKTLEAAYIDYDSRVRDGENNFKGNPGEEKSPEGEKNTQRVNVAQPGQWDKKKRKNELGRRKRQN